MPPAARLPGLWALLAAGAFVSGSASAQESAGSPNRISLEPLQSLGGLRPILADEGVSLEMNYLGDTIGVVSGGLKQGAPYAGRFEAVVEADLEKTLALKGMTFHAGAYQIHGNGPSENFIGDFAFESDVEALPTTRLDEVWLEQKLLDDRASLRVGQIAADVEFSTSPSLELIIGGAFGWHPAFSENLPSGGPAYPFATPAVRWKFEPTDHLAFLAAVFNGDPAGPGPGDPQRRNRYGINFRMSDPPFLMSELQFKYGRDAKGDGLGGTIKLGGWRHFGRFDDLRFGLDGLPLADPESLGLPQRHQGDWGVYGLIDQQIFRKGADAGPGVYAFARLALAPPDRNLVDLYFDTGLNFQSMVNERPDDSFGFAYSFAKISGSARGADLDVNLVEGDFAPVRDYEAAAQATYSLGLFPGFKLQPNIQYVIHPGGHIPFPEELSGRRAIPNALILGLRTNIKF